MSYKILVADDEAEIRSLLRLYLENENYKVVEAENGLEALEKARTEKVDLCVLDIMMPEMDGYKVLKTLRQESNIPVIILSAKDADSEKILGLNLGADDYIAKPFNALEAVARINSNIRRFYSLGAGDVKVEKLKVKDLVLDLESCMLMKDGKSIELTPVEYKIMELFMTHPGKVYTKQQIYEYGWDEDYFVADNNIMVSISKLRSKLSDDPSEYIVTLRGLGYRMNPRIIGNMNRYKEIRGFLIKNFIKIVIAISLAEYGIILIYNHTLIPLLMRFFFGGSDFELLGMIALIIIFIVLIGNMIMGLIRFILPPSLQNSFTTVMDVVGGSLDSALGVKNGVTSGMTFRKETLLILTLFTAIVIVLIPYLIGAYLYSRLVIRELTKIEEEDLKKQKEYEMKKNLLLSDIAHDLRTPITTISGYSKALSDGMVSEEKENEYLAAIESKSRRMSDLINLLFDYTKLDSEGFKLSVEKIDICETVREAAAFLYPDIEEAGMELDIDIPEEAIYLEADKLQITRVISNLITNAVRHNKDSERVGIFVVQDYDRLRIMVADKGDKIEEDKIESLFDPFVMGDESRNSRGGSGLGLSIVKKIVDMHGFDIRIVQNPLIKKYSQAKDYTKMFMITAKLDAL